jgi:YggT family protein
MIGTLISLTHFFVRIIEILVIVDVLISYFMSPYHQIRMTLDRLVEPLLSPIRRIIPPIQMIDFSPVVLLILLQLVETLLVNILASMY